MTRFAAAVLIALVAGTAARAGDGAAINVLGFSADGRHFAFEQYGEQDSSGSLYSSIAVIEVAGNVLMKGAPVIVMMDPDDPRLGKEPRDKQLRDVRMQAATGAGPMLAQHGISMSSKMVASAPDSLARYILQPEHVKSVRKATTATLALPTDRFGTDARLVLREFDVALPRCQDLVSGDHPTGFGLTIERKSRPTIHLHRDQTIPEQRRCPDHYGIAEAHMLPLPDGSIALAVVIQYFYLGFEGPDRRFLAVTGRVP